MNTDPIQTVDQYIAGFPPEVQALLQQVRAAIRAVVPEAEERMAYGIPTYREKKNLVHFGGFTSHLGFYPGAEAIRVFEKELRPYKTAKGTAQFPYGEPIPLQLIRDITQYRADAEKKKAARPRAARK